MKFILNTHMCSVSIRGRNSASSSILFDECYDIFTMAHNRMKKQKHTRNVGRDREVFACSLIRNLANVNVNVEMDTHIFVL